MILISTVKVVNTFGNVIFFSFSLKADVQLVLNRPALAAI